MPIELPPLRKRAEEIPSLAHFFLEQYSTRFGIEASFTPEALYELAQLPFKGNVRELSHLIQRLLIVTGGGDITGDHIHEWATAQTIDTPNHLPHYAGTLRQRISQFEKDIIQQTIEECGSQAEAAKILGVHQSTLSRKL